MAAAKQKGGRTPATLRTLWAIAKSPELGLSEEDLHAVVFRETGKESMKKLTQSEIGLLAGVLQRMKDGTAPRGKHTDEGGDPRTVELRRKIYMLCEALGWNDDSRRINGFVKRMCGVERLEWITPAQCGKIIEALKSMATRQEKELADGRGQTGG